MTGWTATRLLPKYLQPLRQTLWLDRRCTWCLALAMAHAAKETLVTVEEIVDGDLLAEDEAAAGTIPALYISAIAEARSGAWPPPLPHAYGAAAVESPQHSPPAPTPPALAP